MKPDAHGPPGDWWTVTRNGIPDRAFFGEPPRPNATPPTRRTAPRSAARRRLARNSGLRAVDPSFLANCEAVEEREIYRAGLIKEPRINAHDQELPWQELVANATISEVNDSELLVKIRKPVVRGVYDYTTEEETKLAELPLLSALVSLTAPIPRSIATNFNRKINYPAMGFV
jgi:hypothetical protein